MRIISALLPCQAPDFLLALQGAERACNIGLLQEPHKFPNSPRHVCVPNNTAENKDSWVGKGGFSVVIGLVDHPAFVLKIAKSDSNTAGQGLYQEYDAMTHLLSLARNEYPVIPEVFGLYNGYTEEPLSALLMKEKGSSLRTYIEVYGVTRDDSEFSYFYLNHILRLLHKGGAAHNDLKTLNILTQNATDISKGLVLVDFGGISSADDFSNPLHFSWKQIPITIHITKKSKDYQLLSGYSNAWADMESLYYSYCEILTNGYMGDLRLLLSNASMSRYDAIFGSLRKTDKNFHINIFVLKLLWLKRPVDMGFYYLSRFNGLNLQSSIVRDYYLREKGRETLIRTRVFGGYDDIISDASSIQERLTKFYDYNLNLILNARLPKVSDILVDELSKAERDVAFIASLLENVTSSL